MSKKQKIDYAKLLLTQTNVSLEIIAADCGWKSERAFATAFRHGTGVMHAYYRNRYQN